MSSERKDEHVRLAEQLRDERRPNGFDDVSFVHHSFNGLRLDDVDTSTEVVGARWAHPFYINAMTGGSAMTGRLNAGLATAAAAAGVAIASGSVSPALRDATLADTFTVIRDHAPDAFVFANVSAEMTVEQAQTAVDLLDANALQIHVNPAQELVMPEGDRDFRGWLDRIEQITAALDVPVVVKEVGFGLSRASILALIDRGVRTVDVSGTGGTNFIDIENQRRERSEYRYLAGWGQSSVDCLLDARLGGDPVDAQLLASGGVRTPLDVVRALALGASAVGVSGHFLHVLIDSGVDALTAELVAWTHQVRTILTLLGAASVADLAHTQVLVTGASREFSELRGIDVSSLARRS
ncbi:type 2 isopentenyl-diphosphate Delta-isomerase [Pseudoclavibacter soli]|uniref:type 2 isopentenyl-diphosphate Delta-isomerase n=1 Tax=Pseudoclavibacter soli TaxID=452623 RepID=UPI000425BE15|nr:type 2 isopentenyl-diphosphate Delta-isomerase [Pseudoclavibacter soli]